MAARRTTLAVLAVGIALLAGCAPADPNLQPTYSCTPDDGSSPYACPKVQYDAKAKEAALYTEAEQVYRKFFAEHERINRAGGITEPTPALLETTTGEFLSGAIASYQSMKAVGASATGGTFDTVWIRHAPRDAAAGSIVTIKVCTDSHTVQMNTAGGSPEPGLINIRTLSFFRIEGVLKIGSGSFQQVARC
jgi:hypothetical protein